MNTFGTIDPKEHTVERFYANAPISWTLVSSSIGCVITDPTGLDGAVTIERATNSETFTTTSEFALKNESGIYEYVLYSSIKTLFYNDNIYPTSGLATLSETSSYVVSIGQQFYGDRISPGSFTLAINSIPDEVYDDGMGNLRVSSSYVGRIFYDRGIAVITTDTLAPDAQVSGSGLYIVSGSEIRINYTSDIEIFRHQINVKLKPTDFNFALLNPSMQRGFTPEGPEAGNFTSSMESKGIEPVSGSEYSLYRLMASNIIKPYTTTIGFYNDNYELLTVAKLSVPIQRTFEAPQIFIVKFDT